ncbi:MAG TPA: phosphodiester glycosidase family protein [Gemmatimonadaceae bacterium]|nr:phosphodiester glycosidase family protein [Gemmatimonadaceae bacterium]
MGRSAQRLAVVAAGALVLGGAASPARVSDALAVFAGDAWQSWWRADRAPARWASEHPVVRNAVTWHRAVPGLEWGELRLSGAGEAWRLRVILARVEPSRFNLRLAAKAESRGRLGPWSVSASPEHASLAMNVGQFSDEGPWGWVMHEGREFRAPGVGPLSMAVLVDTSGAVRFVTAESLAVVRARGGIVEAFQSYPVLLTGDGAVPDAIRESGRGVDLAHRDSRLAIGELRDGRLLVALTRFEGLGGALSELPFGPTVPEMAALMGALGARQAVMLDGGLSGQMLVRGHDGSKREWQGLRRVPLGLVAVPRD